MKNKIISKNQIGIAGEFAVLSQLALRGYDANMTLGNTKSVDILVSNPESKNLYKIEVKTHYDSNSYCSKDFGYIESHWRMQQKHETIEEPNLFYCFVSIAHDTNHFNFYIIPSFIVAQFVRDSHRYWLNGDSKRKDSMIRSFMLGKEGETYGVQMPLLEDYKDRWDFLK